MKAVYSISDLAAGFDVTTKTIRFYEDQGLIAPLRQGTLRLFWSCGRSRLQLVLHGKRPGFSLSEISKIFDMYNATLGELSRLRPLISKISDCRAYLLQQLQDIEATLSDLDAVEARCLGRVWALGESI